MMRAHALADFLESVLETGRAVFADAPFSPAAQDPEAVKVLQRAFQTHRAGVAGPCIDFDAQTALAAACVLHQACWLLVSRRETYAEIEKLMVMPVSPRTAAQHLSADLTLRLLPQVHRRARAHDPADVLSLRLTELLRQWPLSGALANIDEGPLTPLDFAGHPGLLMLYAERLSQHHKPAWMPQAPGLEYVELVRAELKDTDP